MARKQQTIKVILHPPEDQKSLDALQETTTLLYAEIILNKISKVDLTLDERECRTQGNSFDYSCMAQIPYILRKYWDSAEETALC